ncbi:hypothetical protein [Actinopolyspora saharensis]|uniref:Uncharacterized protein n=1 Tax=Actinopolyspora saharensis TaxID=995062 RepID=A0A1H0YSY3_9ACTN|nr:hypothetical protein [Actinopolyspora saharensis]SDQ18347.1 hypothetical protein SAMN04489718_0658 [Actinopolyspora saharensis]
MILLVVRVFVGLALVVVALYPGIPPYWRGAVALTVTCGVLYLLGRTAWRWWQRPR